jgi:hypothetical protein
LSVQKVLTKLKHGKEQLKKIVDNSSSISNELFFVKKDGGQTKIIDTQTREDLDDGQKLREYRKAIDEKIIEQERKN